MPSSASESLANRVTRKATKVVVTVHLTGQLCDLEPIRKLSQKYKFKIIEDASMLLEQNIDLLGNCKFSDITVFSFHPVKIITTGEGGAATTNNENYAEKLKLFRSHGITKNQEQFLSQERAPWYYEQLELGFNYRLTDIQAALGYSQLKRLNSFLIRRHDIARKYDKMLDDVPIIKPFQERFNYSAFHLYVVRIHPTKANIGQLQVFRELHKKNVMVNLHYIPVYKHPFYQNQTSNMITAQKLSDITVKPLAPMFPNLTEEQIDYTANTLKKVCLET